MLSLAGLPSPFASADVDCLHYVCNSGGVLSQKVSPDVSDDGVGRKPKSEQAPAGTELASSLVTNRHQLAVCGKVEVAGIAPASRCGRISVRWTICRPAMPSRSLHPIPRRSRRVLWHRARTSRWPQSSPSFLVIDPLGVNDSLQPWSISNHLSGVASYPVFIVAHMPYPQVFS